MASLSKPNPMSTVFNPKICSKLATIGIDPPPRNGTGFRPNELSMAAEAALYAVESVGVTAGCPPCMGVIFTETDGGAMALKCFSNNAVIVSGLWFGTNRMEILADALLAMTVLAPSPV